ncbi:MAG: ribulose phosphate epimerase [Atopobiaceae bacterium]|jgi:D-allulose-6-phosphate 3-epimerase
MHTKIAPSLMNMGLLHVAEDLHTLDPYADYYHVDIIDGHYVRNMCLTPHFIAQIKQATDVPIEAHLYVEGVDELLVRACLDSGAAIVTVPSDDAGRSIHRLCDFVHGRGAKIGVFVNPYQSVEEIRPYAEELDNLIILSVDPGFTGQSFIPSTMQRITQAADLRTELSAHFSIAIDGGCNASNFEKLITAGCDVLNLGRGLFDNGATLREAVQNTVRQVHEAELHAALSTQINY